VDADVEEKRLHISVARAKRNVQFAKRQLALSRLQETSTRFHLDRLHFQRANEKLEAAELEIGRLRLRSRGKHSPVSASTDPPRDQHNNVRYGMYHMDCLPISTI
jgi:hypothetical protein